MNYSNKTLKYMVKDILVSLQDIETKHLEDEKGHLDIKVFNELPQVKKAIKELEKLKITRGWLFLNGFANSGMVLYKLKN